MISESFMFFLAHYGQVGDASEFSDQSDVTSGWTSWSEKRERAFCLWVCFCFVIEHDWRCILPTVDGSGIRRSPGDNLVVYTIIFRVLYTSFRWFLNHQQYPLIHLFLFPTWDRIWHLKKQGFTKKLHPGQPQTIPVLQRWTLPVIHGVTNGLINGQKYMGNWVEMGPL